VLSPPEKIFSKLLEFELLHYNELGNDGRKKAQKAQ